MAKNTFIDELLKNMPQQGNPTIDPNGVTFPTLGQQGQAGLAEFNAQPPSINPNSVQFPTLQAQGQAGLAEFNAGQSDTFNAATMGAPDFNQTPVSPFAAQAFGNAQVNIPPDPRLGGNLISPVASPSAQQVQQPPNALLDLAEREGALGPKLSDIFSGREASITEGGSPQFLPSPTSATAVHGAGGAPTGQMAASVPTAPTAPIAPPSTGGTITRDATGEIFNLQQPTGELATFEDRLKETIASGGTTQAMRAQSAREASPSASPTQVAAAQREQVQREAEGAADRAAAEYSRGLSLDGQSIGAINEKVAEFRAAYMLGQEGEGGKASTSTRGGRTHAQGIAEERLALDKAKFVDEVVAREGAPADLTAAQKKFAEKSGESAHEWDQGGRSRAKENIEKFNTVLTDLEDGNLDTRTLVEFAPFVGDWARSAVNPTGQQGLDTIRGVIFQGLRDTLGAQFTEREGERLVNAAYNTKLDEASNIARLKPALARMRDTFAAKEALTQHILAGGSVRDYKGKTPWEVYNGAGGSSGGSPIEGDVDIAEFDNALL